VQGKQRVLQLAKVKHMSKTVRINHIVEQAREFLPDLTLNFFMSQMKAFSKKRAQGMRWSENDANY